MPLSPFYSSPAEEQGALRRAAARAGCRVTRAGVGIAGGELHRKHAISRVECADGWAAARLVLALAIEDSDTDGARELAAALRRDAWTDRAFIQATQDYVRHAIRFVRDRGEQFAGPDYAFELGEGDCEDQARAVYAILRAGGVPVRLVFLHRGEGPTHAVAQAKDAGGGGWVETTIAAELGEHPNEAARRLGLANERTDLAEGVRIMTEKELRPIPKRFREVNAAAQVERDAAALCRLGFLKEDAPRVHGDPTDLEFRRAVLAFQRRVGIVADGLIGPQTRRAISGSLPGDEFGMGYIAELAGGAPSRTKHLAPAFFVGVEAMAKRFRDRGSPIDAFDLLAVWNSESGVGIHRVGLPPYEHSFVGLNMLQGSFLPKLGWAGTFDEYAQLPFEEQLPIIDRFYESNVRAFLGGDWSKLSNATQLYMMNFTPAYIRHGDDPDYVIADRDDPRPREQGGTAWIYTANKYFDPAKKGTILVRDLGAAIERAKSSTPNARAYWAELVARQKAEGASSAVGGGGSGLFGLALLVAAVGGAVWMNR